ncbi:hypothetical protein L6164_000258 [Bauhinia variegata]|uniref:Uncharacterized protein n=1 Tax=Bauhinia variegata TaxID=167791 RepID=A0ACB9Q562_BAUVA|nr:hypothetical protein L6164_000258 [Bauhinia variegata]
MCSPEIDRSVSHQALANSHFSGSGSHHNHSHKKPSSSRNFAGNPRIWSKNDACSNMVEPGGSSPYYKGLTDQSLAIYKTGQSQLASSSSSDYNRNRHPSNVPLASHECSRYYRGLIDYTLAISAKQLASGGSYHELDHSFHSGGSHPCECSPYYKGLTDYTLALLASHGSSASPGVGSNPNFITIPLNPLTLCFTRLNAGPGFNSSSSSKGKTDDLNRTVLERKEVNHDLGFLIEEEQLRERVSESCMVEKLEEEEEEITEKPLRESISVSEQGVASELTLKNEYEKQEKYTWENKYQPKTLGDFICNKEKAFMLQELGEMVARIEMRIKRSTHHVEVNLSDTKGYEKHVLVDLFNETYEKLLNSSAPHSYENCHAIVLYESEKLSTESLLYIKWLLEKYKGTGCHKVFFCCSDRCKLQAVKALCTTVKLAPPTCEDIVSFLKFIGQQEEIELPHNLAVKIVEKSKNNLRQAIRSFDATCQNKLPLEEDQVILTGWEDEISNIAKSTIEEQSTKQLYNIRRKLQNLMIHNVSPSFIFMCLEADLKSLVDEPLRPGVAKLCKEYNGEAVQSNSGQTRKDAISYLKLEEFIARFMGWYKNSSGTSSENVQLEVAT